MKRKIIQAPGSCHGWHSLSFISKTLAKRGSGKMKKIMGNRGFIYLKDCKFKMWGTYEKETNHDWHMDYEIRNLKKEFEQKLFNWKIGKQSERYNHDASMALSQVNPNLYSSNLSFLNDFIRKCLRPKFEITAFKKPSNVVSCWITGH